jgi:hypothetical protein
MKLHMSGMDIDALSRLGSTAVQCAANCGQAEAMRFLIQCGANLDKTNLLLMILVMVVFVTLIS